MNHIAVIGRLGAIGLAGAWLGACAEPKPEPAAPSAPTPRVAPALTQTPPTPKNDEGQAGVVSVDRRVAEMCELAEPRFAFDSSALSQDARESLDAIVACFVDGAGRGKAMKLVGHADPRGETIYNFGLGQRRAGSVASYFASRGLGESRIDTSSRGELDATGYDEPTWAQDRRVDILLAD